MSLLSFFGLLTPTERVARAEEAIRTGLFEKADDQIKWLVKNAHPSAAATQARLHLAKAHLASSKSGATGAFAELDLLYALRTNLLSSDPALLAEVERESSALLISSTEALAAPAEKTKDWATAAKHYEAGLNRIDGVTALRTASGVRPKLYKKLVDCHTEILRIKIQPLLNQAAKQQEGLDYNGAESSLEAGLRILAGPYSVAVEAAAASLRLPTQTQLATVRQARSIAQLNASLNHAQGHLGLATSLINREDSPIIQSEIQGAISQVISLLVSADQHLRAAKGNDMPALTNDTVLADRIHALRARTFRFRGEHYERANQWVLAEADFDQAHEAYKAYGASAGVATMTVRKGIVAIKSRTGSVVTDGEVIRQAEPRVQIDLAYRAVLLFLGYGRPDTAAQYLPYLTEKIPEAELLTKSVHQQRLIALRKDLESANTRARDETAHYTDLLKLYDELPSLCARVNQVDVEAGNQVSALLPFVFGRLIIVGLAEEEHLKLLDLLTTQPNFHTDPETLKNIGIVCLRLAVNNQITAGNYQWVISLWLTAIFSNRVLLASLERTTWDDELTFTLAGSLGLKFIPKSLENVNLLAADSNNIALVETQLELKQRFEDALHTIADEQLQRQAVAAYDFEVNALTKLVQHLNGARAILFAKGSLAALYRPIPVAPYAAGILNLGEKIVDFLCASYQKEPDEALLDCALLYQPTAKQAVLQGYVKALEFEKKAVACFEPPRRAKLKTLPGLFQAITTQFALKDYPKLEHRLKLRLADEARAANKQEPDGELVSVFEALISCFPEYEPFKVSGAHHLCDWCVGGLNSDSMEPVVALQWLTKGWGWVPDDGRLAANLCIVFGRLASELAMPIEGKKQAGMPALIQTLGQTRKKPTRALIAAINEELVPINDSLNTMLAKAKVPVEDLKVAAARESDMLEERDTSDPLYALLGLDDFRLRPFHNPFDIPKFTAAGIQLGKALLVLDRMVSVSKKRPIF